MTVNKMAEVENITLSLSCAICLDVASADNAVETSCCHQLFCLTCIENVHPCPACRNDDFQALPAHLARRLIGSLTTSCPNHGCSVNITRSDLSDHLAIHCKYRSVTCPDPECQGFKCSRFDFLEHLNNKHTEYLLENFEKLWQKQNGSGRAIVFPSNKQQQVRVNAPNDTVFDDRIETKRNIFGRNARLGSTGKFYCNGQLDGSRCSCCNGRCGPTTGCNCSGCMLLDIQHQKLPQGWLVNREGGSARCSEETPGKFYCGRGVMVNDRRTDGYCGPTNGEQCFACQKLNEQQYGRYEKVWQNRSS